jgi:hypothetical protein
VRVFKTTGCSSSSCALSSFTTCHPSQFQETAPLNSQN